MKNTFLVAAPSSNSGKTILTLGLIKVLKSRGLNVQPFKCGPDYIDPIHHSHAAGNQSYNLDVWMSSKAHLKDVFTQKMQRADIGIVEGVMGLFDGAERDKGSSAEVAQLLNLPVILIVNAAAAAYSVAPLLHGFKNFKPDVKVKGVIFNRVSGESHYSFLKEAADDVGVASLGYVPKCDKLRLESRHLGLSLTNSRSMTDAVEAASRLISRHVDIATLLAISKGGEIGAVRPVTNADRTKLKFAVAHDDAFNFMYPANIDCLKQLGEVVYFSPLKDGFVPDADLLWLPGGYPELFAEELAANKAMLKALRQYEAKGGKLVAECGGMMYLGQSIRLKDGDEHRMVGIFDYSATLQNMKLKLGYRTVIIGQNTFKGHEFHYSLTENKGTCLSGADVKSARGTRVDMPIYRNKNCWSSYFHIYLGEMDKMKQFIDMLMLS